MRVIKRSGKLEDLSFDKVTKRIRTLCVGLQVSPEKITQKTMSQIVDMIKTSQLDEISADIAANMSTEHTDYEICATRIYVSNMHKTHPKTLLECLQMNTLIDPEIIDIVTKNAKKLIVKKDRDNLFGYFGLKTMEKIYLAPGETPGYMFMRVALGIHRSNIPEVLNTYELLSTKMYIHATPTMINSGKLKPQMSSCFLTQIESDSISGIYKTLENCAQISKHAGGIGIHVQDVRASGSRIKGTNGKSDGIIPMLRVFNATARYVNQSGARKGSFAVYLEPWHADIFEFLELRLNQGDEESRCRDLFTALWIPDLFMRTVESNGDWALFCPNEAPGLSEVYGEPFETLYTRYVKEGRQRKMVPASTIWNAIIKSQIETGTPYILYKDTCNARSNQRNLGILKGSNLCTEILEYTSKDEIAVCNLASISLPSFVDSSGFNFERLHQITKNIVGSLNKVIDGNFYPVLEGENSNKKHRPIGIGVQGLADVYMLFEYSFDSKEAFKLNRDIFETIYHGAIERSVELAREQGVYSSFVGSPASEGLLQFDLAGRVPDNSRYNWDEMRRQVRQTGLRNSLLIAPMPTATTSQVLGNNECFEPYTTNIYLRRTLAGEFVVINKHLIKALGDSWTPVMKNKIIEHGGSIQNIPEISDSIKSIFKTSWELSQKVIIDQARDRGAYICQSQSMNLFVEDPTIAKMSSIHMYTWKQGLKTGMYYLRTRPKAKPIQVTVPVSNSSELSVCRFEPGCQSCGS
jgi:ribonucleoside-diphosphate reductase alpha subunit